VLLNLGQFDGATLADDDAGDQFDSANDGSDDTGSDALGGDALAAQDASDERLDGAGQATPADAGDATAMDVFDGGNPGDSAFHEAADAQDADVTTTDAVVEGAEAAEDAAPDGTLRDAQDAGDAAIDGVAQYAQDAANEAGDAAAVDWCIANSSTATILCRDFDDGKPWGYLFDSAYDSFTALLPTVTTTDSVSPPSSLLLLVPALDAGQSGNIQLTEHLQYHSAVDVQAAVKLVGFTPGAGSDLELLRVSYNSGTYWVSWGLGSGSSGIEETIASVDAGNTYIGHNSTIPPVGTWFNVALHVDFGSSLVSMTYNGQSAVSSSISNPPLGAGASLSVTVGVNWVTGVEAATQIFYDNVLINAQ
jgi:hypothetical protein